MTDHEGYAPKAKAFGLASEGAKSTSLDIPAFRSALGAFATGVTIVTANDGADAGVTANSFNSVSLDPPLVLWSLGRSAKSLPCFQNSDHFAVHVLSDDQEDLSSRFATSGTNKFVGLDVERGYGGVALLKGCNVRFQCKKVVEHDGGDHIIFVGEVVAFDHEKKPPLLFHGGRYALATHKDGPAPVSESLALLLTSAYHGLRFGAVERASAMSLSLGDRHTLGALLEEGGQSLDDVNELGRYTGILIDKRTVDRLATRGLLLKDAQGNMSITDHGKACVIELTAITKAHEAEVEIRLGAQAIVLKRLLSLVLDDQKQGQRYRQHIDVVWGAIDPA